MATIKIACPKCGQKVSGDESFFGTTVTCPVCTSDIHFPAKEGEEKPSSRPSGTAALGEEKPFHPEAPVPPARQETSPYPPAASPEAPPQGEFSHLPPSPHQVPLDPEDDDHEPASRHSRWEDEEDEVPSPLFGAISLISSILGIVTCVGGILFAPLAIIFGHTALARAKHSPVRPAPGQTLAVVGVIIGYIYLIFVIIALVVAVLFGEQIRAAMNPPVT